MTRERSHSSSQNNFNFPSDSIKYFFLFGDFLLSGSIPLSLQPFPLAFPVNCGSSQFPSEGPRINGLGVYMSGDRTARPAAAG